MNKTLLFAVSVFFFSATASSQVSVISTNGYSVNINVQPTAVKPTSASCQWGYSFNVEMTYNITFSGSNIPASLYTLQGKVISSQRGTHTFDLPNEGGAGKNLAANGWTSATDCATVTPASAGFTMVQIIIEGPGIPQRTISLPVNAVLPVKLTGFSADLVGKTVKVKWATASEQNNNFFTVERSADGMDWAAIREVKGAGTTNEAKQYEITDLSPLTGVSYYRVRQTDFDGNSTTSEVRTVKNDVTAKSITLFPVPNTGNTVNISGITDFAKNDFALLNTSGHVMYSTTLSGPSVQLPSIAKGVYFIRISNKATGEVTNLRYVKM